MQRLRLAAIVFYFFIVLVTGSWATLSHYNLFVVLGEDYPGRVYQLKVLPNGEIIDPNIQYPLSSDSFLVGALGITSDNQYLLVTGGDAIDRFKIEPNGNLFSLGSTTTGYTLQYLMITPNNELVVVNGFGGKSIFSLTSTGDLIDEVPAPSLSRPQADPLGRGVLGATASFTFSAFTIDYPTRTLHITTTFPTGHGGNIGFTYTHDGKLGFVCGNSVYPPDTGDDLWVLNIDSAFNVTTTSQIFNIPGGNGIPVPTISKDNRYLWAAAGSHIELLTIDTATGQVTDTGRKIYVLDTTWARAGSQRNTPDDTMTIVHYDDTRLTKQGSFATAWINGDGSFTWTGYSYNFDSVYAGGWTTIVDFELVPVYVTGVPKGLWEILE